MMKLLVYLGILLILQVSQHNVVEADSRIFPKEGAPADVPYQLGCWNSGLKQYIPTGRSVSPVDGNCRQLTCLDDGSVVENSCGYSVGNCDVIPGNPDAGYPNCCSSIKCREGQSGYQVS